MDIPEPTFLGQNTGLNHFNSRLSSHQNSRHSRASRKESAVSFNFSDMFSNVASHENSFREIFGSGDGDSSLGAQQAGQVSVMQTLGLELVNNVVSQITNPNDLIALGRTCTYFNQLVTGALYRKIQVVNGDVIVDDKSRTYLCNEYTILKFDRLKLFVRSLINNVDLLNYYIEEIVILTNSEKLNQEVMVNPYDAIYDLISKCSRQNLKVLNFDFHNVKQFNNYLNFVKNKITGHNTVNLYEQLSNSPGSSFSSMPISSNAPMGNLRFYQLLDLNDINHLPLSTDKLSFFSIYSGNFNPNSAFQPSYSGLRALYNLNSLYLHSSLMSSEFLETISAVFSTDSLSKIKLTTLSITTTHKSNKLSFESIASIFEMSYLKHFELKCKCARESCHKCVLQFMEDWKYYETDTCPLKSNDGRSVYLHSEISASSYCYYPRNSLTNSVNKKPQSITSFSNIESFAVVNKENNLSDNKSMVRQNQYERLVIQYIKYFKNLKFLVLNLNDFSISGPSFITEQSDTETKQQLLELKRQKDVMLRDILGLKHLETLIIPEYLYSWSIYMDSNSQLSKMSFVKKLNSCHCLDCSVARRLFSRYCSLYNSIVDDSDSDYLLKSPLDYYSFYYNLLEHLRNRLPFKSNGGLDKVCTSLNFLNYPVSDIPDNYVYNFVSVSDYANIDTFKVQFKQDLLRLFTLIIHSLRSDLRKFATHLNRARTLVLGGLYFNVEKLAVGKWKVRAIYDSYEEVFETQDSLLESQG